MKCSVVGCETAPIAKGLCKRCYNRLRRQSDPEKAAAARRAVEAHRERNGEALNEASRVAMVARYRADPEKARDKARAAYAALTAEQKAERAARHLAYQRANPEVAKRHKAKYRTRKSAAGGEFTTAEWAALLDEYRHTCPSCGVTGCTLAADHVVPVAKGGHSNIGNIQPLCQSCNSRKRMSDTRFKPWHLR